MGEVTIDFLREKLKLFLRESEVEEVLNKVISSAGLAKKESYSGEEVGKIVEAMIAEGSFVEFVGRNIRARLLLEK
ncbi:MAG: hypothetical protein B6D56_01975 [Candidatus Omnitrophica bacterium 4484_70.1]|nr:MAG: hypothetical protein B6D56_01975 [Candidatus Omnitrophica bacterium 4484_70.1]